MKHCKRVRAKALQTGVHVAVLQIKLNLNALQCYKLQNAKQLPSCRYTATLFISCFTSRSASATCDLHASCKTQTAHRLRSEWLGTTDSQHWQRIRKDMALSSISGVSLKNMTKEIQKGFLVYMQGDTTLARGMSSRTATLSAMCV
jgi:hypothetical protein